MGGCSVDSAVAGCGHACGGCMDASEGLKVDVGIKQYPPKLAGLMEGPSRIGLVGSDEIQGYS